MRKKNVKFEIRKLKMGWMILLLSAGSVFGFDAIMTLEPPVISLNESAQLSITVRNAKRHAAPTLPKIDGLTFSRPSQSTQRSWINGKSERSTTYTFRVYPQRTGTFPIGPFNYTVDGTTQPLQTQLNVVATSSEVAQPQSWDELIFAKLTTPRGQAYVQEPFELTLSIYSRQGLQLAGNINLEGMPKTGLSELEWQELSRSRETIDGQFYDVRRFRSMPRALGSGTFEFSPALTVHVATPNQSRKRDPFFGSMFQHTQTRPIQLQVEKAVVTVLSLPADKKPADFNGAVGRFNFSVTAQPTTIQVGDPITLTLTLHGQGNLDRILPPTLPENEPFRLFGDAVRQQGQNGVRFEQVISPRDETATRIPAFSFSYFDTQSGSYRTLHSREIPITVTASPNPGAQIFAAQETLIVPADQPFASESDIQRFTSWTQTAWRTIRPWVWILPASVLLSFLFFVGRKWVHIRRQDTAWIRRQQAPKAIRKALKNADKALQQHEAIPFYNALWETLGIFFGSRLNLPPGEIIPSALLNTLDQTNLAKEHLTALHTLFEHIEMARYSATSGTADTEKMTAIKTELTTLLKRVEKVRF